MKSSILIVIKSNKEPDHKRTLQTRHSIITQIIAQTTEQTENKG